MDVVEIRWPAKFTELPTLKPLAILPRIPVPPQHFDIKEDMVYIDAHMSLAAWNWRTGATICCVIMEGVSVVFVSDRNKVKCNIMNEFSLIFYVHIDLVSIC